jgi:hypothetical protein
MNDIFMFKDCPQYPGSECSILGQEVTLILYLTSDVQVGLYNNIQGFYILIHDIHTVTNTGIFWEEVTQQQKNAL